MESGISALASWVPAPLLVIAALFMARGKVSEFMARLERVEKKIDAANERLPQFATIDQLGRFGDRIDGRTTNLAERVAVLEALRKGRS